MLTTYPKVKDEFATVVKLREGYSIARFGDGELKIMDGAGYAREPANANLTQEVREVFMCPSGSLLLGVPTMNQDGPKGKNWLRHEERFKSYMKPGYQYYSAFISRPDSAPWIRNPAYALLLETIWLQHPVVAVVCEKDGSILPTVRMHHATVKHIECPLREAYKEIDNLQDAVVKSNAGLAIISAGPTATCLAARLCRQNNIMAIDMGSAGGFLGKLLRQVER